MPSSNDLAPIRGHVRARGYRRVSHGLFLRECDGRPAEEEQLRDLAAWLLVLPDTAVFTHLTAAWLRGWRLPALPEQVPVFAAVDGAAPRPRRPGLVCSRLRRTRVDERFRGLPVDSAEEVLLRCARDLGWLDLGILLDSAIRSGQLDRARMTTLLESRRPGVALLRRVWRHANARSESAGETLLRLFHVVMRVPVTPQVRLVRDDGTLLGVADLAVDGTNLVHEYDGAHHRAPAQHRTDLRRERGWAGSSFRRHGFTLDDLLGHAGTTMHEIDRSLGRAHDPRRLAEWRDLVRESLYSETGRRRVVNRWRRAMGFPGWVRAP